MRRHQKHPACGSAGFELGHCTSLHSTMPSPISPGRGADALAPWEPPRDMGQRAAAWDTRCLPPCGGPPLSGRARRRGNALLKHCFARLYRLWAKRTQRLGAKVTNSRISLSTAEGHTRFRGQACFSLRSTISVFGTELQRILPLPMDIGFGQQIGLRRSTPTCAAPGRRGISS